MTETEVLVDADELRQQVSATYRAVAANPSAGFHFHTGRDLAHRLGYARQEVKALPEVAVESFAGVGNPFDWGPMGSGARVVDAGSGAGFDSFIAASQVGSHGKVIGIDMTPEMLEKAQGSASLLELSNVSFRYGILEDIPVEDGWSDVVISNGVFNLCADKPRVFSEVFRVLRPGGRLQFADIANGKPVPEGARRNIDLWCA